MFSWLYLLTFLNNKKSSLWHLIPSINTLLSKVKCFMFTGRLKRNRQSTSNNHHFHHQQYDYHYDDDYCDDNTKHFFLLSEYKSEHLFEKNLQTDMIFKFPVYSFMCNNVCLCSNRKHLKRNRNGTFKYRSNTKGKKLTLVPT